MAKTVHQHDQGHCLAAKPPNQAKARLQKQKLEAFLCYRLQGFNLSKTKQRGRRSWCPKYQESQPERFKELATINPTEVWILNSLLDAPQAAIAT